MARIIYSGLVTSIRGSVGGTTFQASAYGFSIKNKANMIRPNSEEQNNRKLCFSTAVNAWINMSDTERSFWESWAATFPQYSKNNPSAKLSGYAAFVKYHALRFLGSNLSAPILTAPSFTAPAVDNVTISMNNPGSSLIVDLAWVNGDNTWFGNYKISQPVTDSQIFTGTRPRFMFQSVNIDGTINVTNAYVKQFGTLATIGQTVFVALTQYGKTFPKVLAEQIFRIRIT